jgi:hypothetical protein
MKTKTKSKKEIAALALAKKLRHDKKMAKQLAKQRKAAVKKGKRAIAKIKKSGAKKKAKNDKVKQRIALQKRVITSPAKLEQSLLAAVSNVISKESEIGELYPPVGRELYYFKNNEVTGKRNSEHGYLVKWSKKHGVDYRVLTNAANCLHLFHHTPAACNFTGRDKGQGILPNETYAKLSQPSSCAMKKAFDWLTASVETEAKAKQREEHNAKMKVQQEHVKALRKGEEYDEERYGKLLSPMPRKYRNDDAKAMAKILRVIGKDNRKWKGEIEKAFPDAFKVTPAKEKTEIDIATSHVDGLIEVIKKGKFNAATLLILKGNLESTLEIIATRLNLKSVKKAA